MSSVRVFVKTPAESEAKKKPVRSGELHFVNVPRLGETLR